MGAAFQPEMACEARQRVSLRLATRADDAAKPAMHNLPMPAARKFPVLLFGAVLSAGARPGAIDSYRGNDFPLVRLN